MREVEEAGARDHAAPLPGTTSCTELLRLKSRAHDWVRATERVWDFYFELFGQRQSAVRRLAVLVRPDRPRLLPARVHAPGLDRAASRAHRRSPTCAPASRPRRTGATSRCAGSAGSSNPFPLVQLPYHRLVNPWTMGAILHEVSHNLQNELELERRVPLAILQRVRDGRRPRDRCAGVGAVEPRDLRRHGRLPARWRGVRRVADGRDRPRARAGLALLPPRRAPDAVPADVPLHRAAAPDGLPRDAAALREGLAPPLPVHRASGTMPAVMLRTWPDCVPAVVRGRRATRVPVPRATSRCAR